MSYSARPAMKPETRQRLMRDYAFARKLVEHGHRAGTSKHGVVVSYNGYVWRVVGGDAVHPSLMILHGVREEDVCWMRP